MPKAKLTNANDEIPIDISKFRNGTATVATGADANAGCVIVLELESVPGEFIAIQMWNPMTSAWVANITGPSQTAWADIPSYRSMRARRTDSAGGASTVVAEFRED